jgi:hypothetical protein
MNGETITAARKEFSKFVEKHECYDGQICVSTKTFWRELAIPIFKQIKKLEKKTK